MTWILPRWSAPLDTAELITPAPFGFEKFTPRMQYFLIDEGSYQADYLASLENLAAAIFLIETQTTLPGLYKALNRVLKWQSSEQRHTLGVAIARLARRVLRKKLGHNAPALDSITDLKGVVSMLEENIENIILESKNAAMAEGRAKGLAEGQAKGLAEGQAKGLAEGQAKGLAEGQARGLAEGKAEGLAVGQREGSAAMLKAMLASRFGPLPTWVIDRIDAAPLSQLTEWGMHLFDSASLENVFDPI